MSAEHNRYELTGGNNPYRARNLDYPEESFILNNRSFEKIDTELRGLPRATLRFLVQTIPSPVKVLDLAGGIKSQLVQDLARDTELGHFVDATNIDLFVKDQDFKPNARARKGDALDLESFRERFDLVLSHEFIGWLSPYNNHERKIKAYLEIAKVLTPGGISIASPVWLHQLLTGQPYIRQSLAEENVEVLQLKGNRSILVKSPVSDRLRDFFSTQ